MLRGLLRLGVLPGLCGGAVSGRGEGEVYEVARDAGEVKGGGRLFVLRERERYGEIERYHRTAAVFIFKLF